MADLPGIHFDGRPRIQGSPQTWAEGLVDDTAIAAGHLPRTGSIGYRHRHGLGSTAQSPTDEDGPEESPPMVVHASRESHHPLLIGERRFAEIDRAPIGEGQR